MLIKKQYQTCLPNGHDFSFLFPGTAYSAICTYLKATPKVTTKNVRTRMSEFLGMRPFYYQMYDNG